MEWVKADGERSSLKDMIQFLVAVLKAREIRLSKLNQVYVGKEIRQYFIKVDPAILYEGKPKNLLVERLYNIIFV